MSRFEPVKVILSVTATLLIGAGAAFAAGIQITSSGVGFVDLGDSPRELRDAELIGSLRQGCELAGPRARTAKLKAPPKGSVNFTVDSPRVVDNIQITGGAKASGVGVGATRSEVRAEFPNVKFDNRTETVFGITLAKIPVSDGGRFQMAIDVDSNKVTLIGVPIIAFCE